MSLKVAEIVMQSHRKWTRKPPASEADILRLVNTCPVRLPDEYLDLLRFSNGGEGDLALPPLLFVLFEIDEVLKMLKDSFFREEFPHFVFFGGNGGLETFAFNLSKGTTLFYRCR